MRVVGHAVLLPAAQIHCVLYGCPYPASAICLPPHQRNASCRRSAVFLPRWLDTGSHKVRSEFARQAEALHAQQRALFKRIGVELHRCTTDGDIYELFARVNGYE
jgi:hypothetical protein